MSTGSHDGGGLLLWALAATCLEQRPLAIPDLAVVAAGDGGGAASAAGVSITALCTAASSGSMPADSLAADVYGAARPEAGPVEQRRQRQEAAATAFVGDSAGGLWQLAIGAHQGWA